MTDYTYYKRIPLNIPNCKAYITESEGEWNIVIQMETGEWISISNLGEHKLEIHSDSIPKEIIGDRKSYYYVATKEDLFIIDSNNFKNNERVNTPWIREDDLK